MFLIERGPVLKRRQVKSLKDWHSLSGTWFQSGLHFQNGPGHSTRNEKNRLHLIDMILLRAERSIDPEGNKSNAHSPN